MVKIRKSNERGQADHGWLKAKHSFSFSEYYDPEHMQFSVLRVINEDRISAGGGFGTHGHKDMEIITYVIEGLLEHKDSLGTNSIIKPGELQRMSAGTGVRHSEFNPSATSQTHLLQIWLIPARNGIAPGYEQIDFSEKLKSGEPVLVASRNGRDQSISICQNVELYACKAANQGHKNFAVHSDRKYWLQVIKGQLEFDNYELLDGDAAAIENIGSLNLTWQDNTEFLLFDLPA